MTEREPPAVSIVVCATCKAVEGPPQEQSADGQAPGLMLADAVRKIAEGTDIEVREVDCLANCKRSLSAGIFRHDGWSYVFGDLSADSARDLLDGALLFQTSENGVLPWRGRPDSLKRGLIARFPPLHTTRKIG